MWCLIRGYPLAHSGITTKGDLQSVQKRGKSKVTMVTTIRGGAEEPEERRSTDDVMSGVSNINFFYFFSGYGV